MKPVKFAGHSKVEKLARNYFLHTFLIIVTNERFEILQNTQKNTHKTIKKTSTRKRHQLDLCEVMQESDLAVKKKKKKKKN